MGDGFTIAHLRRRELMMWPKRAAMSVVMIAAFAVAAPANQWNDRTTLKFETPIMVPGATLTPGTYVFKLMDSDANRHMVQIFKTNTDTEADRQLITTTQAVPVKRMDAKGDVVLKLNPTEAGAAAPAAIEAWFYPGSLYGHKFVYPEDQARDIAQRTKTLVLSGDVRGSDMQKATLHTYDASGNKQPWRVDAATMNEWTEWTKNNAAASAQVQSPGTEQTRESTAPAMRAQSKGMEVKIDDLETNPKRYIGQTISVTAEVDEVFGPRLFKIDEPNWGDLDGEVLVYLPSDLAALVNEADRVTVTGTMKMFVDADLEREFGWLEPDPDIEVEFTDRPVLVADRVVGGNNNVALSIRVNPLERPGAATPSTGSKTDTTSPVGTSGRTTGTSGSPVTSGTTLGKGDRELVGRHIDLDNAKVNRTAKNKGFWIDAGGTDVLVIPAPHVQSKTAAATGQTISIEGVVLAMPKSLREKAGAANNANDEVYVYATTVK
jgi:hypothetical protein